MFGNLFSPGQFSGAAARQGETRSAAEMSSSDSPAPNAESSVSDAVVTQLREQRSSEPPRSDLLKNGMMRRTRSKIGTMRNWQTDKCEETAAFPAAPVAAGGKKKKQKLGHADCWAGCEIKREVWLNFREITEETAEWKAAKAAGYIKAHETVSPLYHELQTEVSCSAARSAAFSSPLSSPFF